MRLSKPALEVLTYVCDHPGRTTYRIKTDLADPNARTKLFNLMERKYVGYTVSLLDYKAAKVWRATTAGQEAAYAILEAQAPELVKTCVVNHCGAETVLGSGRCGFHLKLWARINTGIQAG